MQKKRFQSGFNVLVQYRYPGWTS